MWVKAIKRLITQKRTEGLLERVNIMFSVGQLTQAEYLELIGLLTEAEINPEAVG